MNRPTQPWRRMQAFVLIEVLLALSIFGMAAVALIRTLARTSQLAVESQMDTRMILRLQSKLTEFSKMNNLSEWDGKTESTQPDELGVWTDTKVYRIEPPLKNKEGQELQQMYAVEVVAFYSVDWKREPERADAIIWRYLPLYRATGNTGAGTTPAPAQ